MKRRIEEYALWCRSSQLIHEFQSDYVEITAMLHLKAFLILAQTILACSTSARKQDDLRQLTPDQHVGQLAFPISAIRQLATTSARVPISSSSRFISLVAHSTLLEVKVIQNLKENP
ncbi:hypothetical protein F2Q70_00015149 [Brassica cretica]|uniref:Uncharacterized protein n=1 Tax=Brassica cretica TaxID=69181 RepID=A0A8S9I1V3_BRACR|nr:hypothetical protein F2Q70_00015149 [Brassica cretica]